MKTKNHKIKQLLPDIDKYDKIILAFPSWIPGLRKMDFEVSV